MAKEYPSKTSERGFDDWEADRALAAEKASLGGEAEALVNQAYKSCREYMDHCQKQIAETQAKLDYWHQEFNIVERFLATDQSTTRMQQVRENRSDEESDEVW